MTANRIHFTDTDLKKRAGKIPEGGERIELTDDERPYIRARLSHKLVVFYWIGRNPTTGKVERHKLGELGPAMSTEAARKKAAKLKQSGHDGVNIKKAKRETKRAAEAGRMTVRDMAKAYIARCAGDGKPLASSTLRFYNTELPRLLGDYFDRPADALDADTLLKLVRDMAEPRMVQTVHGNVRRSGSAGSARIAVNCLVRLCKVYEVPCPGAKLRDEKRLPVIGARKGRIGSLEAQALFAWLLEYARGDNPASHVRSARMLAVAIATGWRIGTVQALAWDDIDFTAGRIHLPKNKTDLEQTLPLSPVVADLLKPLRQKTGPVFPGRFLHTFTDGMPYACSPHDMRKAFASAVLQALKLSEPPLILKLLMGHTSGDVTVKHYLEQTPVDDQIRTLRPTVDAVSAFFAVKLGNRATLRELDAKATVRGAEKLATRRRGANAARTHQRAMRRAKLAA